MSTPKGVCVKVSSIRPKYDNLEEWCANPKHILVTRRGRVFITTPTGKYVFHYSQSEWANPYTVKKYPNGKALELYEEYLTEKLTNGAALGRFLKLFDAEQIGCFCDPGMPCHRNIILRKLQELS